MIAQLDRDYIRLRPTKALSRLASHVLLQGRPLTSKMQWLNPILLSQFECIKHLPQLKLVNQPIFVLGTGRSGTTILGKVLSMHKDVLFLNEPKALWYSVIPNEDLIGNFSRNKAHYRLMDSDANKKVKLNAHRLYGYCLALTSSSRILDKYPEMIFRVSFLKAIFPDARFLFLIRNGWDTIQSISSWSQSRGEQVGSENHDWWGRNKRKWHLLVNEVMAHDPELAHMADEIAQFSNHCDMAAIEWITAMREGLRLLDTYGGMTIYPVRYEDLVSDPTSTLQAIVTFCELPEDHKVVEYANIVLESHPSKKPIKLDPVIEQPFLKMMSLLNYT